MAEVLGHGKIIVDVEQNVQRELDKAKRALQRALKDFERERAVVDLDANLKPLQRKVEEAERKIVEWREKAEKDAELGLDTKNAERRLREWERKLEERRVARDEVHLDTTKAQNSLKRLQVLENKRARAFDVYEDRVIDGEAKIAAARKKAADAAVAAEWKKEKAAQAASDKQNARAAADLERDRGRQAQLLRDYATLQRKIAGMERRRAGAASMFSPARKQTIDLDIGAAKERSDELEARLDALGVDRERVIQIGVDERNAGALGRFASALADTTIRLGPFTTSIGTALRGLTLFAPAIAALTGSVLAFAGVLSAGILGGLGAVGTLAAGLVPIFAGVAFAINPMVGEFAKATTAQENLRNQTLKYGKGSDQAKKAQEQLNSTLKEMDPAGRRAVRAFDNIRAKWTSLTQASARQNFGKVVGEGLKTAQALLPMFATQTNRAMSTLSTGISRGMQALRTPQAASGINSFLTNINNILPGLMRSFGNLGVVVGRVMLSFSRGSALGSLIRSFEQWSARLKATTSNTANLNRGVDTLVRSFRNSVSFIGAAGRVLKEFFRGATGAGNAGLRSMTDSMNRLADSMSTVAGQRKLNEFFTNANNTTGMLFQTLKPLMQLFVEWATIMRPLTDVALTVTRAISQIVAAAAGLGPVKVAIQAAFALFLGGRIIERILQAASAMRMLTASMIGLGVAGNAQGLKNIALRTIGLQTAATGAGAAMGRFGSSTTTVATKTAAAGAAAGAAGSKVGVLRAAATKVIPAIGGLGAVAGGAATLGVGALAAGAIYGSYKLLTMKTSSEKLAEQLKDLNKQHSSAAQGFRLAATTAADAGSAVSHNRLSVKQLREEVRNAKKGTDEHAIALLNLRDKLREGKTAQDSLAASNLKQLTDSRRQHRSARERVATTKELIDKQKAFIEGAKAMGDEDAAARGQKGLDILTEKYAKLRKQAEAANNRLAAVPANLAREAKGMLPVLGQAEQQLGRLGSLNKDLATKVALKFEMPQDVGKVAAAAARALRAGVPKKVVANAALNTKGLDATLAKLRAIRLRAIRVRIIQEGGEKALALVRRLVGTKIMPKVMRILGQDTSAKSKIRQLIALGIPPKIAKMLGDNADALNKAAQANRQKLNPLSQAIQRFIQNPPGLFGVLAAVLQPVKRYLTGSAKAAGGASGGAFAGGGSPTGTGSSPDPRRIERADAIASRRAPRESVGGVFTKPTHLVGEENKPEVVIAGNPAYRRRNLRLLGVAARMLGVGNLPFSSVREEDDEELASGAKPAAMGKRKFKRSLTPKGKKAYRKTRGFKGKTAARMKHMKAVIHWQEQEDKYNREANLKEMSLDEPESFLKEVGKAPDGTPIMALDEPLLKGYIDQMTAILNDYGMVVFALKKLNEEIPKARDEQDRNVGIANKNIDALKLEIKRQEGRAKSKNTAVKKTAQRVLPELRGRLRDNEEWKSDSKENIRTLDEEKKEAAWRFREAEVRKAEYREDITAVDQRARKDAADQAAQAAGGGGGLSYGEQALASDTEKARVLREFGGNTYAQGPQAVGGSPADGGMLGSPAGAMGSYGSPMMADGAYGSPMSATGAYMAGGSSGGGYSSGTTSAIAYGRSSGGTQLGGGSTSPAGGAYPSPDGSKTVTITNNYQQPPEDPHLWSREQSFYADQAF